MKRRGTKTDSTKLQKREKKIRISSFQLFEKIVKKTKKNYIKNEFKHFEQRERFVGYGMPMLKKSKKNSRIILKESKMKNKRVSQNLKMSGIRKNLLRDQTPKFSGMENA